LATTFEIRSGDTSVVIADQLTRRDGTLAVLTGATVRFLMDDWYGVNVLNVAATITDAVNGKAQYTWLAGDTARRTTYRARWVVTFSGGAIQTFPTWQDDLLVAVE
jgi:hypothetical protein